MKALYRIFGGCFLLVIALSSCVQDDDFDIPQIVWEEPNITVNTDILAIKSLRDSLGPVLIGDENQPLFLEAYVVSSDASGNIFKQLFIQDKPANPTAGIVISTHYTNLYAKYGPGQKIYFQVDGLYIGDFWGMPTIGTRENDAIGRIPADEFENRIHRSLENIEPTPQIIRISQATDENLLGTLVRFENVQFTDDFLGDYYGNPDNTTTVNRMLENCDGATIAMRNSGFSDFKNELLPEGNGSVTALLTVFADTPQIYIRDISDVELQGQRCDTAGDPLPGGVRELPFYENFEGEVAGDGEIVAIEDWTNTNVNGGERLWEVREFSRNKYAQTSAFASSEDPYEVWLITPGIWLPEGATPTLTFETKDGYYRGDALSVKIATDFDDDIAAATWHDLDADISRGNTDGYGDLFVPSGAIDLTEFAGEIVHIAFRYYGSSNDVTTTYQIDSIAVE